MIKNPFNLNDKTILVTGASSGIGKAVAIECSNFGAKLIITGRDEERLNDTFSELKGGGHHCIISDLKTEEGIKKVTENCPVLNGLVHCAGIVKTMPLNYIKLDETDDIFKTNFFAPLFLTQSLIKERKLEKGSSIVFISSVSGIIKAQAGNSVYSASKGAIMSLAKVLALELSNKKIRVNCILPGMVKTRMTSNLVFSAEEIALDEKKYPLGYGEPIDVALGAIYLLSDASKWVTGSNLLMDGGFTL